MEEFTPLYHWSPRSRRGSILEEGLRPGKRNVTGPTYHNPDDPSFGEFVQSCVCLSADPATAWAYSHGVWMTEGRFDLWQFWTCKGDVIEKRVENDRVVEVRIFGIIEPKRLHWIGERLVQT